MGSQRPDRSTYINETVVSAQAWTPVLYGHQEESLCVAAQGWDGAQNTLYRTCDPASEVETR
jgi:hypothetical protein